MAPRRRRFIAADLADSIGLVEAAQALASVTLAGERLPSVTEAAAEKKAATKKNAKPKGKKR